MRNKLDKAIKEARNWIENHGVSTKSLPEQLVIQLVHENYEGSWPAFLDPYRSQTIWLLMARRYGLDFADRMFNR